MVSIRLTPLPPSSAMVSISFNFINVACCLEHLIVLASAKVSNLVATKTWTGFTSECQTLSRLQGDQTGANFGPVVDLILGPQSGRCWAAFSAHIQVRLGTWQGPLSLLCSVHCAAVIGGRVNLILLDNWSLLTVQKGNNPWVEDTLCHETPAATLLSPVLWV